MCCLHDVQCLYEKGADKRQNECQVFETRFDGEEEGGGGDQKQYPIKPGIFLLLFHAFKICANLRKNGEGNKLKKAFGGSQRVDLSLRPSRILPAIQNRQQKEGSIQHIQYNYYKLAI